MYLKYYDRLKEQGKIRYYGVSVETVEEGLFCLEQPNVNTLQVIFNLFSSKAARSPIPAGQRAGGWYSCTSSTSKWITNRKIQSQFTF